MKNLKHHIAYVIGRLFPITICRGPSKGMKLYGNIFYNRLPAALRDEEILYAGLDLTGKIVVEAGTHVGVFTWLFAQRADRVFAFEPNPQSYEIVRRNLRANRVSNVELVNVGLSDRVGHAAFLAEKFAPARGTFKCDKHDRIRGSTPYVVDVTVELTTVDKAIGNSLVDFVKVDTEGFEPMVLAGMSNTIARCSPDIYFEIHGLDNAQKTADFNRVFELLPRYRIFKLVLGLPQATPSNIDELHKSERSPGDGYIAYVRERDYLTAALKPFRI